MEVVMGKLLQFVILGGVLLLTACKKPSIAIPTPVPINPTVSMLTPANTPDVQSGTPAVEHSSTTGDLMVQLSMAALSKKLDISADQIKLVKTTPIVWKDASLGCPKPGIDYIRVETPGFLISLETGGNVYDFHTDEVKRVMLCNTPKP
jgi:hypothetical protein